MAFRTRLLKIFESLENSRAPFFYYLLSFAAAVLLRIFVEFFTSPFIFTPRFLAHLLFFYLTGALGVALCLRVIVGIPLVRIMKLICTAFGLIILAPLIDLLLSGGAGFKMTYLLPQQDPNLLQLLMTFGFQGGSAGITPGIKIEVFLGLVGIGFYSWTHGAKWFRVLLAVLTSYLWIFFLAVTPFIFQILAGFFKAPFHWGDYENTAYFMILSMVLAIFLGAIEWPRHLKVFLKSSRWLRVIAFALLAGLGFGLGLKEGLLELTLFKVLSVGVALGTLCAILALAFLFNDTTDRREDKIANRSGYDQARQVSDGTYQKLIALLAIAALSGSALLGLEFFVLTLMGLLLTFVYSAPPLRLKRVLLLSKVVVALNALLVMAWGFLMADAGLAQFPQGVIVFFVVAVSMGANFIDLKDYQANQKTGIPTLPSVLGFKRAQVLTSVFFLVIYYWAFHWLNDYLDHGWILILGGVIVAIIFNLRPYREKYVLWSFLGSLIFVLLAWRW